MNIYIFMNIYICIQCISYRYIARLNQISFAWYLGLAMIQSRPHHNIIDVLNIMTSENDDKQRMIKSDSSSINKPVSQLKVSYSLYV